MSCMATFPKFFFFFLLSFTLFVSFSDATIFEIRNQCPYTVWAAASPGGGRRLDQGQRWTLDVPSGTKMGRIWGRTHCNFDDNGYGKCLTGDCGGVLECKSWGTPPNTLAEYALKQFGNKDFYDISLVDGFNVPMEFSPTNDRCRSIKCGADITSQCPDKLKHPHGCHNPCTVFKTEQYCCNNKMKCGPTTYSKFFKQRCPTSYSYPQDDPTSTFTCSSGSTHYNVVFCPRGSPDTFPLEMLGSLVV